MVRMKFPTLDDGITHVLTMCLAPFLLLGLDVLRVLATVAGGRDLQTLGIGRRCLVFLSPCGVHASAAKAVVMTGAVAPEGVLGFFKATARTRFHPFIIPDEANAIHLARRDTCAWCICHAAATKQ